MPPCLIPSAQPASTVEAPGMGKRKAATQIPESGQADGEIAEVAVQPAKIAKVDVPHSWKNKEKVLLLSSRGITHRCFPGVDHNDAITEPQMSTLCLYLALQLSFVSLTGIDT